MSGPPQRQRMVIKHKLGDSVPRFGLTPVTLRKLA